MSHHHDHHHHDYHHHHHHCKSLFLAYVLWFFFGIFGVHRFYLGRPVSGFIYLFTAGIVGIGFLVDLFALPYLVRKYNEHHFPESTIVVAPSPIIYQISPEGGQRYPYQPQPYYASPYNPQQQAAYPQQQPAYGNGSQNYNTQPYSPPPYQP